MKKGRARTYQAWPPKRRSVIFVTQAISIGHHIVAIE